LRWVLITAFGVPVEPEVNRNLAMVSGVMAANAFATSDVSGVAAIARNAIASPPSPLTMVAECSGAIAASAAAKGLAPETKIAPGPSNLIMPFSLSKSLDISEYAGEIAAVGTPTC